MMEKLRKARKLQKREGTRRLGYHALRFLLPKVLGQKRGYRLLRTRYYNNETEFWREKGKYWIEDQNFGDLSLFKQQADYLDSMFSKMDVEKSDRILDGGCGYGKFTSGLSQRGYQNLVGADLSGSQLRNGRQYDERIRDVLINASLTSLPFETNAFDAAFSWGVMTHIPDEKIYDACREYARVSSNVILHIDDMNIDFFAKYGHDLEKVYSELGHEVRMVDWNAPQPESADLKLVGIKV